MLPMKITINKVFATPLMMLVIASCCGEDNSTDYTPQYKAKKEKGLLINEKCLTFLLY